MYLKPVSDNYIVRLLKDPEGRLARVTFRVYERDGRIKARVVSVEYVDESAAKPQALALSGGTAGGRPVLERSAPARPVPSPFVNESLIFAFGTKPRAPSMKDCA